MSCTFNIRRSPRRIPTDVHEGSRADFLDRVAAEATAAARDGGAARDRFLVRAFGRVSDTRTLYEAALYVAGLGGPARGADGVGPADLDRPAISQLVRVLTQALRTGTYRPGSVRHVEIPKTDGGTRRLSVMTVADRIVERAVVMVLTPFLDPQFSPTTYGGRPGRSTGDALAAAEVLSERTGGRVVVTADVRKAFDNIPDSRLVKVIRARLGDTDLTDLLEHLFRSRGPVGVPQGGATSMLMLNAYLDAYVDRLWRERHPDRPLIRWADDLLVTAATEEEGNALLADLTDMVAATGMELKDTAAVTDLTKDGVDWIGYRLGTDPGGNLTARIAEPAWTQLEEALKKAHDEKNPDVRARDAVRGWIASQGPTHHNEDWNQTVDRIGKLLTATDFPGTATGNQLHSAWEKAGDRYSLALTRAQTELALTAPMEMTDNGEAAAASPARTLALIVPAAGVDPTPSTHLASVALATPPTRASASTGPAKSPSTAFSSDVGLALLDYTTRSRYDSRARERTLGCPSTGWDRTESDVPATWPNCRGPPSGHERSTFSVGSRG